MKNMKIKNFELEILVNEINDLLLRTDDFITKFKLFNLMESIKTNYDVFEKVKKEIYLKFGEQKDDRIEIKPENIDDFQKDFNELMNQEVELSVTPIPLNVFQNIKVEKNKIHTVIFKFIE